MPRRCLPRVPERRRTPDQRLRDYDEVAVPYSITEAQQEALRCLRCQRAPCTLACPLGTKADVYVPLIAEGRFAEAAAVVAETDPFPAICARVCHHPCEDVCLAGKVDAPVAIRALKHFLVTVGEGNQTHPIAAPNGAVTSPAARRAAFPPCGPRSVSTNGSRAGLDEVQSASCRRPSPDGLPAGVLAHGGAPEVHSELAPVAVVGSGPSGLAAARDLAALGHAVTVFEALPEPGGLLRWGIPAFRLPRRVVAEAIAETEAAGVEFRPDIRFGRGVTLDDLFDGGYRAVLLAIGAHRSRPLKVPGEDLPWVVPGLDFLRELADGAPIDGGTPMTHAHPVGDGTSATSARAVVVIGGGDAAVDAARSARRLGAAVTLVYRRSRAEMPARREEVAEAEEEGVAFRFLAAPVALYESADGERRVRFEAMRLEPAADGGRPVPAPVPGADWEMAADLVVVAVGQEPDPAGLPPGLHVTARGSTLEVDPATLATSVAGVFACGDAAGGRANVTDAAAMGRRAAQAIHEFLTRVGAHAELTTTERTPARSRAPAK